MGVVVEEEEVVEAGVISKGNPFHLVVAEEVAAAGEVVVVEEVALVVEAAAVGEEEEVDSIGENLTVVIGVSHLTRMEVQEVVKAKKLRSRNRNDNQSPPRRNKLLLSSPLKSKRRSQSPKESVRSSTSNNSRQL